MIENFLFAVLGGFIVFVMCLGYWKNRLFRYSALVVWACENEEVSLEDFLEKTTPILLPEWILNVLERWYKE